MKRRAVLASLACLPAALAARKAGATEAPSFVFPSIDGGEIDTAAWRGRPVLVVNTASLCGFAPQLATMETLHETWGPRGLKVLATPSNDFDQELDDAKKVKEFCTIQFGITLPMTDILHVKGAQAHPFYAWLRDARGFVPSWNFNKALLGPDGQAIATWGAFTPPDAPQIVAAFAPYLAS